MMKHMMVDLETFGTTPDAGIVQGGGVAFMPRKPAHAIAEELLGTSFERAVTLQSCLLLGGRYMPDTRDWWCTQKSAAQQLICRNAVSISEFLDMVDECYLSNQCSAVWSHGASFDIPILEFYYAQLGRKAPWKFYDVRDTRTLFWMAAAAGWIKPRRETAHGGLADSKAQVEDVCSAMQALSQAGVQDWLGALL